VALSSGLLFIWGLGASIGPFLVGQVMQYAGSDKLFPSIAVGSFALALFTAWKISRQTFHLRSIRAKP
jgi:hypothetical protein